MDGGSNGEEGRVMVVVVEVVIVDVVVDDEVGEEEEMKVGKE